MNFSFTCFSRLYPVYLAMKSIYFPKFSLKIAIKTTVKDMCTLMRAKLWLNTPRLVAEKSALMHFFLLAIYSSECNKK